MHKPLILLSALMIGAVGITGIYAQQIILTTGGDASGTGGSASWSVGQVAYTYDKGEDGSSSLGVQQPYRVIMVGIDEPAIELSVSVYPNPFNDALHIRLELLHPESNTDGLSFGLHDIHGKLLLHQKIVSELTTIPLDDLTDAVYLLQISRNASEIETFKIFKTQ